MIPLYKILNVITEYVILCARYDLLPFYARLVATLFPCMPDVANELVQYVKSDLRWHVSCDI